MNKHEEYLQSEDWKIRRKNLIEERGNECERCHKECIASEIRVHHKNYIKEFGFEDDKDLMISCEECHNEFHIDIDCEIDETPKKECSNCGSFIVEKPNKFPIGYICRGCFLTSTPEQIRKWNEEDVKNN